MRSTSFISTEEVVAEAVEALNDADFTHGIGRSYYELIVHRTIEELALSTFFQRVTQDIFNWNSCGNFTFDLPKNMFNLREIYFFNSSCDKNRGSDCCSGSCSPCNDCVDGTPPVVCGDGGTAGTGLGVNCASCCNEKTCWSDFVTGYWKRQFNRFGESGIKTAERTQFYYESNRGYDSTVRHTRGNLVYFGVQNGQICVSDSGKCFKNVRLVANGFGTDNCELPIIPRELRNVCVDSLKVKGCQRLMLLYPEYKQMYQVYSADLNGSGNAPGSRLQAERFVKSLNSKQREDYNKYYSNPDIK